MKKFFEYTITVLFVGFIAFLGYRHTQLQKREAQRLVVWPSTIETQTITKSAYPLPAKKSDTQKNFLEIRATYPTNTPFASLIGEKVAADVAAYIAQPQDILPEPLTQSMPWNAVYTVTATHGKKLISYLYEKYEYSGGAHGGASYTSYTYDTQGTSYALKDLFVDGADYLGALATIATRELAKPNADGVVVYDATDPIWAPGLDPKPENYATFTIDGDALVLKFQQYQIAPYYIGAPELRIPIDTPEIAPMLRKELF